MLQFMQTMLLFLMYKISELVLYCSVQFVSLNASMLITSVVVFKDHAVVLFECNTHRLDLGFH